MTHTTDEVSIISAALEAYYDNSMRYCKNDAMKKMCHSLAVKYSTLAGEKVRDDIKHPPMKDSKQAFEEAIKSGRLSTDPTASNWAANYMHMGPSVNGGDAFKNIETRQYIK